MKIVLMIAATISSAALVMPTVGQARGLDSHQQVSRSVHFGDLDLSTAEGRGKLDRRVAAALRRACTDTALRGARASADAQSCIARSKAHADRQVQLALNSSKSRKRSA